MARRYGPVSWAIFAATRVLMPMDDDSRPRQYGLSSEPHPFVQGMLFALYFGVMCLGLVAIVAQFVLWAALFKAMDISAWCVLPAGVGTAAIIAGLTWWAAEWLISKSAGC